MDIVTLDARDVAQWEWAGEQEQEDGKWTYNDIQTVVERVNRGAQLLDEQEPGWVERVFPDRVSMRDGQHCIIGQVYGNYDEFIGMPFGMGPTLAGTSQKAIDHGFLTQVRPPEGEFEWIPYGLLDAVWVALLRERAHAEGPVFLTVPPQLPRNRMLGYVAEMVEL